MNSTNVKQVIVVRKDLNMRKGKIAAQVSHSSMKVFFDKFIKDQSRSVPGHHTTYSLKVDSDTAEWIEGIFTKICVSVNSESELLNIFHEAMNKGLPCALIMDSGLTEFHFYLCKKCGDAIYDKGNTLSCGYPLCECGDDAEVGEKIPVKTYTLFNWTGKGGTHRCHHRKTPTALTIKYASCAKAERKCYATQTGD